MPARTRDRIEVTEDGCWLSPIHPPWKFRIQVAGRDYTVRFYLWLLAGHTRQRKRRPMPKCGNDRCLRPSHCSSPWKQQGGVVKGRQYAALSGLEREIAAQLLEERGYKEAPFWKDRPGGHLRIGEYRKWRRGVGISWVEPPGAVSAYRSGKGEHYELMTGRKR